MMMDCTAFLQLLQQATQQIAAINSRNNEPVNDERFWNVYKEDCSCFKWGMNRHKRKLQLLMRDGYNDDST